MSKDDVLVWLVLTATEQRRPPSPLPLLRSREKEKRRTRFASPAEAETFPNSGEIAGTVAGGASPPRDPGAPPLSAERTNRAQARRAPGRGLRGPLSVTPRKRRRPRSGLRKIGLGSCFSLPHPTGAPAAGVTSRKVSCVPRSRVPPAWSLGRSTAGTHSLDTGESRHPPPWGPAVLRPGR